MRSWLLGCGACLLAAAPAPSATAQGRGPLERYVAALARGEYGAAWMELDAGDRRRVPREEFIRRYRALGRVPWFEAVLRSASVDDGRVEALDWTHTRWARAGLLADPEALRRMPRRRYLAGAAVHQGKLGLGLAPVRHEGPVGIRLGHRSSDWFGLYVSARVRCRPAIRFLLLDLASTSSAQSTAYDCLLAGSHDELLIWASPRPRRFRRHPLRARVAAVVPRGFALEPFAAPDPRLVGHPAFPGADSVVGAAPPATPRRAPGQGVGGG